MTDRLSEIATTCFDQAHPAGDPNKQFQIIVPVFNEAETLDQVIGHAKQHGYLEHIVFVDDASTDASPQILHRWAQNEGIQAICLQKNRRKEGAIRAAMEALQRENRLAPYTVLLDSDSIIAPSVTGETISSQIEQAVAFMRKKDLGGLAFQIDATSNEKNNLLSNSAFADYAAMQFDQWLVGKQQQLWVITGPGGLFETQGLLAILQRIVPDFETGDLLITVELMKHKRPVEFYPAISVLTFVPVTIPSYFKQRRRWERGTTKVLWNENRFYRGLFKRLSLLGLATFVHLSLYLGLLASAVMLLNHAITPEHALRIVAWSIALWFTLSLLKGVWLSHTRHRFPFARYCLWSFVNALVSTFITSPARITGAVEATIHLITHPRNSTLQQPHEEGDMIWLLPERAAVPVEE